MMDTTGVIQPRFAKPLHPAGRVGNDSDSRRRSPIPLRFIEASHRGMGKARHAHRNLRQTGPEASNPSIGNAAASIRRLGGWLLACLIAVANPVPAADIQLSLDRNPVPINESFTLTYTADEEPDGDPDFSPLDEDFEILNQGRNSQFSIVNGKASRQVTWQLQVIAKQPGTLQIPSIAFGSDRSRPFAVTVTNGAVRGKQGGEASLYLETEAEPRNPYVQAQVILTIRVLSRVAFSGDLSQPEIPDAVVEKLDEDREFVSLRDGVQFKVNERRYAVFPQKSGRLTIGPVNLTAQLAAGGGGFGPFFRPSSRQQRLHSDPIDLNVRPIPAQFTGQQWLPAASLALEDQWSPAELRVPGGEPLARTLTVKAEGATAGMLPDLAASVPATGDLKPYPDQPVTQEEKSASGLVSRRQQKTALIATRPGAYTAPAVEIPWWNTRTDRPEVARLPARTLTVLPAPGLSAPEPPPTPAATPAPAAGAQPAEIPPRGGVEEASTPWLAYGLALFLGLGWLATALAWWRSRRGVADLDAQSDPGRQIVGAGGESRAFKALESACRVHDPVAARKALLEWATHRWPEASAASRLECLTQLLGSEMTVLNRQLYAADASTWQGTGLWERFKTASSRPVKPKRATRASGELEPLYKT
jgi:hypothetical protein